MSYTRRYFKAEEHDCAAFLGQQVALPELYEGWHPRIVASLENPLDSREAAWEFVDCMKWGFLGGMDDKLSPEHWGVAWARGCEALFWRLQDLLAPDPLWGLTWQGAATFHKDDEPAEDVVLDCEKISVWFTGGSYNLARDLRVYADLQQTRIPSKDGTGARERLPDVQARLMPNPIPERLESDFDKGYGEKLTYAFWRPMDTALVIHSLDAWGALSGGKNKMQIEPLARFSGDAIKALRHTFGERCAAGMRAYALSKSVPVVSPAVGFKPRF